MGKGTFRSQTFRSWTFRPRTLSGLQAFVGTPLVRYTLVGTKNTPYKIVSD